MIQCVAFLVLMANGCEVEGSWRRDDGERRKLNCRVLEVNDNESEQNDSPRFLIVCSAQCLDFPIPPVVRSLQALAAGN